MAKENQIKTNPTNLECSECGNVQTIHRRLNKQKKKYHVKHVYCYKNTCQKVTAPVEVQDDPFLPDWVKDN